MEQSRKAFVFRAGKPGIAARTKHANLAALVAGAALAALTLCCATIRPAYAGEPIVPQLMQPHLLRGHESAQLEADASARSLRARISLNRQSPPHVEEIRDTLTSTLRALPHPEAATGLIRQPRATALSMPSPPQILKIEPAAAPTNKSTAASCETLSQDTVQLRQPILLIPVPSATDSPSEFADDEPPVQSDSTKGPGEVVRAVLAKPTVSWQESGEKVAQPMELAADTEQLPIQNQTVSEISEEGSIGYTVIEDRPIADLTANIQCNRGDLPVDHAAAKFAQGPPPIVGDYATRAWPGVLYEWEAPGLFHGPLYFEEENLERYGYTYRRNYFLQPLISGGRFVATAAALPYMLTLHPQCEPVYTLGYYRPGSCVPFQARLMELNAKAAAVQGAAVTGLIFAIP